MKRVKTSLMLGATAAMSIAAGSAAAQAVKPASMSIQFTSVAAGITGGQGAGVLSLPNLGNGCAYRFSVEGAGAGIKLGISKMTAQGIVHNLTSVASFPGGYRKSDAEATFFKGEGVQRYKNQRNTVEMELKAKTEGLSLGVGTEGMTIKMKDPIPQGPNAFIVYFGFNKHNLSKQSKAILDKVVRTWKCRYGNVSIVGHTDTVGREDRNLDLSGKRTLNVVNYLVGTGGFVFARVKARAAGEKEPLVPTGPNVRLRSNRAVTIRIGN